MQGEHESVDTIERLLPHDLSSLITLRVLAARSGDAGVVPFGELVERVRMEYAQLAASPDTPMGDVAPPWEATPHSGDGMRDYLEQQVVRRFAAEGLIEVRDPAEGNGDPASDLLLRLTLGDPDGRALLVERLEERIQAALRDFPGAAQAGAAGTTRAAAPTPDGTTLSAQGLVKVYRKRRVVNDVALHVSQGEIVGLLGPNGAGKTTTFYMMVGLIGPDAGRVRLGDEDVTSVPMYRRARKGIGYLAQEPSVFRKLTVEENVLAILQMLRLPKKEQRERLEVLLDELGIKHLRHSKAYSLSGGERRRLEITRALVGRPTFMLLDEPFAGVDPIAVHDIQQIVADLRSRNIGVLISDHNVEQTLDIVDRAYIMYDGRVRVSGTVSELVWNDEVAEIYLGPTLTARMRQRYTYPE
jgi:lipopolysaccharide export system ATP-binding protein